MKTITATQFVESINLSSPDTDRAPEIFFRDHGRADGLLTVECLGVAVGVVYSVREGLAIRKIDGMLSPKALKSLKSLRRAMRISA